MFYKALILFSLVFSSIGFAEETDVSGLDDKQIKMYKDIADDLRCPTCTGLSTLQSSESFSMQIRDAVVEQVKEGKDKSAIMSYFRDKYGIWILREPPKEGFHLVAWAIPGLMLLLGPLLIWVLVWRKRKTVESFGVRSSDTILEEMESRLAKMR